MSSQKYFVRHYRLLIGLLGIHLGGAADAFADTLWALDNDEQTHLIWAELDNTGENVIQSGKARIILDVTGGPLPPGYGTLTELADGSLLGAILLGNVNPGPFDSAVFHIENPQLTTTDQFATLLGVVPFGIEALYTDAVGHSYLVDTGTNNFTPEGNRLMRFVGDFLTGDLRATVIADLSNCCDIDDLGPGIDAEGRVVDSPGLVIDTGRLYELDFVDGSPTQIGNTSGRFGIHALDRSLLYNTNSRVYTLGASGRLFEVDPATGVLLNDLGLLGGGATSASALTGSLPVGHVIVPSPSSFAMSSIASILFVALGNGRFCLRS